MIKKGDQILYGSEPDRIQALSNMLVPDYRHMHNGPGQEFSNPATNSHYSFLGAA